MEIETQSLDEILRKNRTANLLPVNLQLFVLQDLNLIHPQESQSQMMREEMEYEATLWLVYAENLE
jgi:hypothetical protein